MAYNANGMRELFNEAVTNTSANSQASLGEIRVDNDATYGQRWFMYVKAISAVASYAPVIFSAGSAYCVTVSNVASMSGKDVYAGVAGSGGISSSSYGWIQVRGHAAHILTGKGTDGAQCTSADVECITACSGVQSFRKYTLASGSTAVVFCGIRAFRKATEASSTSGYIHCM